MSSPEELLALAESLDEIREMLQITVAGFMADGFAEDQARAMTTAMFINVLISDA